MFAAKESITSFFRPREHISTPLRPPMEPKVVNDRGNVTWVQNWWKKLIDETKDLVGLAGFWKMVDNMSRICSKKYLWKVSGYVRGLAIDGPSFLMYLLVNTLICNSSQIVSVKWLHFFKDLGTTIECNRGRLAFAHLYMNMDSFSCGSTTSLMGYWQLWEDWAMHHGLCEDFPGVDWRMDVGLVVAWHLSQFSNLYEGLSMRDIYLAERVTTQLIGESDIVPIALTPFILFPFSLASEDLVEGAGRDIPLPSWSVTLHRPDGLLVEIAIDRWERVYGLPIPSDCRLANNVDLENMIGLVGSLKILGSTPSKGRKRR
uniref:Aminotransferase-like plant mobile domain-containing protein n=1 Tax=Fagus sylvatica TaxID=28930 RepID=A0A2N9GQC9_FAGSY